MSDGGETGGEEADGDDAPTGTDPRHRPLRTDLTPVVDAMVELGTSTSNVDLAMSSVYANNRDLVDDETDRAFFVRDPVERPVRDGPEAGHPPVHPDHEERGTRDVPVGDAVVVEPDDLPGAGERVWLKGYGCVRDTGDAFEFTDDDIDVVREGDVDVVHWAPADGPALRLRTTDGDVTGIAEPGVGDYDVGAMVQFERVGFARLDAVPDDEIVAYYAHS